MLNFIRGWFTFSIAPLCLGGGGGSTSSSSASTTTTTTQNTDNRQVVSDNGIGLSNSNNANITINHTDAGAMRAATDMFKLANDAGSKNYGALLNTSSDALKGMLEFATGTMSKGFDTVKTAQENAVRMMDTAQSKGTIDNKTMIMLGLGAVAMVGIFAFRK
jgi:hypothetical protein